MLKINDYWATPPRVISAISARLNMRCSFDVCATPENAKAPEYLTESDDALTLNWAEEFFMRGCAGGFVFCNPPYSQIGPWADKCASAAADGLIVVGLLPDDRSTLWHRHSVRGVAAYELIPTKRIAFLHPETGDPVKGNPKGSTIPVWLPFKPETTQQIEITL